MRPKINFVKMCKIWEAKIPMKAQSLYIHFPFCETKCHYCDFYSLGRERTAVGDAEIYEKALTQECRLAADLLSDQVQTVFFGGGTPSMTAPEVMLRALAPLELTRRLAPRYEWTMEANPSSVSRASLAQYRALGVNRVSMGVQAMRDDLLARLGRVHSKDRALGALTEIFEAGFTNVSVDLLCGVPGQELDDIRKALDELTQFPITHLSCYLLTLTPHHSMYKQLPNEDTQLEHLLFLHDQMAARGFEHYEISNFCKPGFEARHNLNYWKNHSYLGLGPSAHSFDQDEQKRWKNISSLKKYATILNEGSLPQEQEEILTPEQKDLEKWMLGLRLAEGVPTSWLTTSAQKLRAKKLLEEHLLEPHPSVAHQLRLTPRGFALSDQVITVLA